MKRVRKSSFAGVAKRLGVPVHETRREQDERVCTCGKRWPVGEDHP